MTIWLKRSECKINFVGTVFSFIVIECRVCVCNMLQGHHNTLYALYEAMDRFFCFFYLHFIMFIFLYSTSLHFTVSPLFSVSAYIRESCWVCFSASFFFLLFHIFLLFLFFLFIFFPCSSTDVGPHFLNSFFITPTSSNFLSHFLDFVHFAHVAPFAPDSTFSPIGIALFHQIYISSSYNYNNSKALWGHHGKLNKSVNCNSKQDNVTNKFDHFVYIHRTWGTKLWQQMSGLNRWVLVFLHLIFTFNLIE